MMQRRKKIWIIIIIIFSVLILSALGILWHFVSGIEEKAYAYIQKEVAKQTNNLYKVEIGGIRINLLKESIKLKNVNIYCDTSELNKLVQQNETPNFVYKINVGDIDVQVYNLLKTYKDNIYSISHISINRPSVRVDKYGERVLDDDSIFSPIQQTLLPPFIQELNLDEIKMNNGNLYYYIKDNPDSLQYEIKNYNLYVKKLVLDSTTNLQDALPEYEELFISLESFRHPLKNYYLDLKNTKLDLKKRNFHLDSIQIIPRYKKYDFAYQTGSPGRVECTFENINIFNIDLDSLAYSKIIKTDSIIINNAKILSYKNKNVPPNSKIKPLFHQMIQELPIKIDIPIVKVENGYVKHEELGKGRDHSGYIEFNNIQAEITELTNIIKTKEQYFNFSGKTRFMNSGIAKITFLLPVDPANEHFNITGEIKGFNMTEANNILEAAANLSIESGIINGLYFNMNGNNTNATMDMLMLYNDMKVALLTEGSIRKKQLISQVANDLFIISDNPEKNGKNREVKSNITRNPYLYHFNYLWLGLFDGIKQSIGLTINKQEQINGLVETLKSLKIDKNSLEEKKEQNVKKKEERQQKKKVRQQRKANRKKNIDNINPNN